MRLILKNNLEILIMDTQGQLNQNFEIAINIVNNLKKRPTDTELLNVYKLFKQAKLGNNDTDEPSMLNFNKKAKWSAWKAVYGMSKEDAMQNYINLAMELFNKYGS